MDHRGITSGTYSQGSFALIRGAVPPSVVVDGGAPEGLKIAARNLREDFRRVTGVAADSRMGARNILVGTYDSPIFKDLLDLSSLKGQWETYIIATVDGGKTLLVAGSDMRGAIFGVYEISEQIGVSPWYDWADVPVLHREEAYLKAGTYTIPEPAVKYRGLFLNDEAPCLTGWVENTYGTSYGDHRFYARVFELLLRLRANFMWPAMWGWAFYADDPLNSRTASTMGIIMGTSHHEPMARNHQEWVRRRNEYGAWDYATNRAVIDKFFTEGMKRAVPTEDLITIGMRGDGDTAMGGKEGHDDEYVPRDRENMRLLEKIITNQRKIIAKQTGRPASERPQVWALYKEVQKYYELGLRVPDDVTILLSDDNWGDVRYLPRPEERNRPGGWGMYYHVDYVGAPRNSKWLNVTQIPNMWEQLQLTFQSGVDRLWVLNVGDLKPMEYPITFFLDMARRPDRFTADNLFDHTVTFCEDAFGKDQGREAAEILDLYSHYSSRTTAEMMDAMTYDLASGEFRRVRDDFLTLETRALRQYLALPAEARDAYNELILFPVQALGNLYDMYYSQAMNLELASRGDPDANIWAERTRACFMRDSLLMLSYNRDIAGGKWNGMMTQKHIGYRSWNDDFPSDTLPHLEEVDSEGEGSFSFPDPGKVGYTAIEAEHFYEKEAPAGLEWKVIPGMGRTRSGLALFPYTDKVEGATLTYRVYVPEGVDSVKVHVIVKSTLPYNGRGHTYEVAIGNGSERVLFNSRLNEEPQNIYSIYYPTVSRRVVESVVTLPVERGGDWAEVQLRPLDGGIVFEKIVLDWGGYTPQFLFGEESPARR